MTPEEQIARVTWEHSFVNARIGEDYRCTGTDCTWTHPWEDPLHEAWRNHNAHQSAEVVEALGLREERNFLDCRRLVTDWRRVES